MTCVRDIIEAKLTAALSPEFISVEDESHGHNVPEGAQSHFKVLAVSEAFAASRPVKRHQTVYGILSEELAGSVHALALHLYTPGEWQSKPSAPESPDCLGGGSRGDSIYIANLDKSSTYLYNRRPFLNHF